MSERFGFNINGQRVGNSATLFNVIQQSKPAWTLVMDNLQMAFNVKEASPQTNVIYRAWNVNDATVWRAMSPETYVNSLHADRRLWWQILNEPLPGEQVPLLVNWLVKVVQIATDRGQPIAVGNLAVGTPVLRHIKNGLWDPLLRILDERRALAALGVHEYTAIALPFGVGLWSHEDMTTPGKVGEGRWPSYRLSNADLTTPHELRLPDPLTDYHENYHHLLRSSWFAVRAKALGIQSPRMVLTEFGMDDFQNLREPVDILGHVERTFGTSGYPRLRGFYTYRDLWKAYWSHWTFHEAMTRQLEWADKIYPSIYEGLLFFMWSFADEWQYPGGFNVGADTELHEWLINRQRKDLTMFPDLSDSRWEDTIIKLNFPAVNVRSEPNTASAMVVQLRQDHAGRLYNPGFLQPDGYLWFPVQIMGKQGWMRDDVFEAEDTEQVQIAFSINYNINDPEHVAMIAAMRELAGVMDSQINEQL